MSRSDVLEAFTMFKAARMVEPSPPDDDERLAQVRLWVTVLEAEGVDLPRFKAACVASVARDSFMPSVGRICTLEEEAKPMYRGRHIPNAEETRKLLADSDGAYLDPDDLKAVAGKIHEQLMDGKGAAAGG